MSYTKIWIHCVWTTKFRKPLLKKEIRDKVLDYIVENAKSKDIYVDCIGGYEDHVHCLISLKREQNIADVMQKIKGESSYWINKNKLTSLKFSWQDDYFAVSIGESQLTNLRSYIKNQEAHHRKKTFLKEYNQFIEKYEFEKG
jgi:REP element-mobilizing transposase RayT